MLPVPLHPSILGRSRFFIANGALAFGVEALLLLGLSHFGESAGPDSPSLGWAFYITQIPGVLIGAALSRSFPETSSTGTYFLYAATFLVQWLIAFLIVSGIRLFIGRNDLTSS